MTPRTATRTPLDAAQELTTPALLTRLLILAREAKAGSPNAVQLAAAAAALQKRCGRPVRTRHLDPADDSHQLAGMVSEEGGILALSAGVARQYLAPAYLADREAMERDPKGGHRVRTRPEVLESLGLAVFPGPEFPAGLVFSVLYERDLLLGQLLAALAAGEDTADLVEEITEAAG
ncbi:hypothetical protein [Streptomyces erythrochromogenes]|uniref:hypothetical protein n=1 Tax=Streptomyces erythrochromogenes TaxID=285574 RepID=UPI0038675AE5|nr:hypothetical protein OG364_29565 [Streptomyces erythrochromogenes]